MGGGKFANGAHTAAFQHLFNSERGLSITKEVSRMLGIVGHNWKSLFNLGKEGASEVVHGFPSEGGKGTPRLELRVKHYLHTNLLIEDGNGYIEVWDFGPDIYSDDPTAGRWFKTVNPFRPGTHPSQIGRPIMTEYITHEQALIARRVMANLRVQTIREDPTYLVPITGGTCWDNTCGTFWALKRAFND